MHNDNNEQKVATNLRGNKGGYIRVIGGSKDNEKMM